MEPTSSKNVSEDLNPHSLKIEEHHLISILLILINWGQLKKRIIILGTKRRAVYLNGDSNPHSEKFKEFNSVL